MEREFGVLVACWPILERSLHLRKKEHLNHVVSACVILHNLVVEDRRNNYESVIHEMQQHLDDLDVSSVSASSICFSHENKSPNSSVGLRGTCAYSLYKALLIETVQCATRTSFTGYVEIQWSTCGYEAVFRLHLGGGILQRGIALHLSASCTFISRCSLN